MIRKVTEKFNQRTLRGKLTQMFTFTALVIMGVNLFMFVLVNKMTHQVDNVYVSNVNLNQLDNTLEAVQNSLVEYMNTKSSDAMEEYYRSEQEFRNLSDNLNAKPTDNEQLIAEKNIKGLSQSYLDIVSQTIKAKRGRNVEKYGELSEEARVLYSEIRTYIYSLNNDQFKNNTATYQILSDSLKNIETVSVSVLLLILLGNISLIGFNTAMITKPLNKLASAADQVANGNFDLDELPVVSEDEVGIVTRAFNQMVRNIRDYIEQLRVTIEHENELKERELMMQSHLKDAQLKYLQAQINPHFLFNTLNAGAQLAMMEGAEKTEELLANTAAFFRYNVRKNSEDATLQEEITLVDNYIYICNVRFSGDIHYDKDIDEALVGVRVPSMILQPLVENAFNYGIRNIEWEGHIELSVYRKNDKICISIWDNGAGMTAERIEEVLSGEIKNVDLASNSNGVGMKNVMERLKLYFHEDAEFEILSEGLGKGTEVLITIPGGDM